MGRLRACIYAESRETCQIDNHREGTALKPTNDGEEISHEQNKTQTFNRRVRVYGCFRRVRADERSRLHAETPSLRLASQIGVLQFVNTAPELANKADKDAILVMSFGTTYKENRAKTIEATVNAIKAAHPGVKTVTAFTSHIIIDRVAKEEGIKYPTPEQALDQLKDEGYTRVALVTLDVIPGMEYEYDKAVFNAYKNNFRRSCIGKGKRIKMTTWRIL